MEVGEALPRWQPGSQVQLRTDAARLHASRPSPPEGASPQVGPWCSDVPEGGVLSVDLQGAGGPRAGSALPDELACAGIVDPDVRAGLRPGVHGCRMEQGSWKRAPPVGEGCRAVLPAVRTGREKLLDWQGDGDTLQGPRTEVSI